MLSLPTGTRLKLGPEAVIELTSLRYPCHQIDRFQSGLVKHCKAVTSDGAVARKAGVMSIVLQGGVAIGVTLPPEPYVPLVYRVPDTGGSG